MDYASLIIVKLKRITIFAPDLQTNKTINYENEQANLETSIN